MSKLNLWVDTIRENHWIPRNAVYFDKLCNRFAIHYGWHTTDEWATKIGLTCKPDIAEYELRGKPDWQPNALLFDFGRNLGVGHRIPLNMKCPKILWSADEHRHHGGGRERNYVEYSKAFNYLFFRQKMAMGFYPVEKSFWFPHSAQAEFVPSVIPEPRYDLVFITASVTAERKSIIDKLNQFNCFFKAGGMVEKDYMETMSYAKIAINKTQTDIEINKRVFETMAVGNLLITNKTEGSGLTDLFQHKKHLIIYNNEDEMINYIKYYLTHEEERKEIANRGREEVLKNHVSDKRAEQIVKFMESKL